MTERRIVRMPIEHEERRMNDTTVKFKLWAVLGFLVALIGIGLGYLFIAQTSAAVERTDIKERVIRMEVNYQYVVQGIADLKESQKVIMKILLKKKNPEGE